MLLTVRQAAGRLGVSYSTLKQWIFKGSVRTTRTEGGHHRVAEVEVERLLAKQGHLPISKKNSAIGSETLVAVSGRNQLRGIVDEIRLEGLLAQVQLRVGDQVLTAIITRDAVSALKLRRGSAATALIKSTEVMIAREAEPPPPRQQRVKAKIKKPELSIS
ncbi:MAG: molybdenum-pterin-binding protein [Acidobacteria bacterium]|nr:molybdenum-pterin-binding protein [Acidobacteriota bacterium]